MIKAAFLGLRQTTESPLLEPLLEPRCRDFNPIFCCQLR